jgi:ribonuclease HI
MGASLAVGHIRHCDNFMNSRDIYEYPRDFIPKMRFAQNKFNINTDFSGENLDSGFVCYTDGSKSIDGVGAGFTVLNLDHQNQVSIYERSIYLGMTPSVFQSEVYAISEAAVKLLQLYLAGEISGDLAIMSDSQAAILSLDNDVVSSNLIRNCKENLNSLARVTNVTIHWIKAHHGFKGNESVDRLAKQGALETVPGAEPFLPISKKFITNIIKSQFIQLWQDHYDSRPAAQTKLFFPKVNTVLSKEVLSLSREDLSRFVRYATGHNFLKRHNTVIQLNTNIFPLSEDCCCRLCGLDYETGHHVVFECPTLIYHRFAIFGSYMLFDPPDHIDKVMRLINHPTVIHLEDNEDDEENLVDDSDIDPDSSFD